MTAYLLTKRPSENTWILIDHGPHEKIQDKMGRLGGDNPGRMYLVASWPQVERLQWRRAYSDITYHPNSGIYCQICDAPNATLHDEHDTMELCDKCHQEKIYG